MNKILTVSQINNYVKNMFDDELLLHTVTVEGEVFDRKLSGGNTYITLKEGDCILSCVKFDGKIEFDVGDKIRVTGSMRFFAKGGRVTFIITYASAIGKGELQLKLSELKEKLSKEGVFDNNKPLPKFINKIALVTSVEGAVIHDFFSVLERNGCTYIDVDVYGVKVQGEGADKTIVTALQRIGGRRYDIVVVARGGGSGQDLDCFNTEALARGVFECAFPVISAVGHEVDYTLCDFSATLRAGTPSIAAEHIVRINEAFVSRFYDRLSLMKTRAEGLVQAASARAKSSVSQLMISLVASAAKTKTLLSSYAARMLKVAENGVTDTQNTYLGALSKLHTGAQQAMSEAENRLKLASTVLDKTSPLKILSDGYAKVIKDGKGVSLANDIDVGDSLRLVMIGGAATVKVTDKE
ncbi:MAG: exodeoxyribonuclease VII large subunit [Clostridia bacterium]|nr:exodeoxyribonuclease VII large subunit [Clostridia bacterium]